MHVMYFVEACRLDLKKNTSSVSGETGIELIKAVQNIITIDLYIRNLSKIEVENCRRRHDQRHRDDEVQQGVYEIRRRPACGAHCSQGTATLGHPDSHPALKLLEQPVLVRSLPGKCLVISIDIQDGSS